MNLDQTEPVGLLSAAELDSVELGRPDGITAQEAIALFQARGMKLSEATFRKYVQLGLLPTSRRVGRKGKHKGSQGVYPVSVVRRINLLKSMMERGMTLEEIQGSFLGVQNDVERAQEAVDSVFAQMADRIARLGVGGQQNTVLAKEIESTRRQAVSVLEKIEKLSSRLAIIGSSNIPTDQGGLP
jgi:DNA-binding transcriptional MerR regulator